MLLTPYSVPSLKYIHSVVFRVTTRNKSTNKEQESDDNWRQASIINDITIIRTQRVQCTSRVYNTVSQCQTLGKCNSKQTLKAKRKLRVLSSRLKEPKFDSIADECIGRPLRPTSEQTFQRNGAHSQHILYAVRLVFAEAQNTQCGKEYNRENRASDYIYR